MATAKLLYREWQVSAWYVMRLQVAGQFRPVELLLLAHIAEFRQRLVFVFNFFVLCHREIQKGACTLFPSAAFTPRDGHAMDFVGTVDNSHRAVLAPKARDRSVV